MRRGEREEKRGDKERRRGEREDKRGEEIKRGEEGERKRDKEMRRGEREDKRGDKEMRRGEREEERCLMFKTPSLNHHLDQGHCHLLFVKVDLPYNVLKKMRSFNKNHQAAKIFK